MAASSSILGRKTKQRESSPQRMLVWTEPHNPNPKRVPVLYYLSTNGQLHHPHFMEVPLSSPKGLFLSDVFTRLNVLRGRGMPSMYSWSCKRSYKNGFVWHDLSENDLVYPAHGHEYVLKGSELPDNPFLDNTGSPSPPRPTTKGDDRDCPRPGADTQRNDEIEVSTPPSDSSPETLGTLMKADGRAGLRGRAPSNTKVWSEIIGADAIDLMRHNVVKGLCSRAGPGIDGKGEGLLQRELNGDKGKGICWSEEVYFLQWGSEVIFGSCRER